MQTLARGVLVSLSALLAWILGLPHAVLLLMAVQVLDVASGICLAWGKRSVSSTVASLGIRKKVLAWIIVLLVGVLQFELSHYMPVNIVLDYSPMEVAALGFVIVESISILENAEALGLWLPGWLKVGLATAQNNMNGDADD